MLFVLHTILTKHVGMNCVMNMDFMLSMKPTLKHTVHGKNLVYANLHGISQLVNQNGCLLVWIVPITCSNAIRTTLVLSFGLVVMNHMLVKILLTWLITSVVLTILVQFTMKVLHGVVSLITLQTSKVVCMRNQLISKNTSQLVNKLIFQALVINTLLQVT